MVYSVLRSSWQVLLAGLLFFLLGHFTYKYQLLYAMDHQQQSTGRAWGMICDRVFVGLVFFQLTTAGQLILKQAVTRSVLMIPLVAGTIWISILYGRAYKPLMQFIALRSVQRGEQYRDEMETSDGQANGDEEAGEGGEGEESTASSSNEFASERNVWADTAMGGRVNAREASQGFGGLSNPDEQKGGLRFVNPSLVAPLRGVWIAGRKNVPASNGDEQVSGEDAV